MSATQPATNGQAAEVPLKYNYFQKTLTAAIERLWESAELVQPRLLQAAEQQIELCRKAYGRIYELVRIHKPVNSSFEDGNLNRRVVR